LIFYYIAVLLWSIIDNDILSLLIAYKGVSPTATGHIRLLVVANECIISLLTIIKPNASTQSRTKVVVATTAVGDATDICKKSQVVVSRITVT
jgi:hypothetical protein